MSEAGGWSAVLAPLVADGLGADASHDLAHFARVWRLGRAIAAQEGGDLEVIEAAAWLHDLVNPPKDSPDRARASRLSAAAALPILRQAGFPAAKHQAVAHAIEAHSFSAGIAPETLEARIVQDADRLEALGAIGIARCFCVSGQMGAALFDPDDPLAARRPRDDRRYALDHFETKLFRVAETLHTEAARRLAAPRVDRMRRFVGALIEEIGAD